MTKLLQLIRRKTSNERGYVLLAVMAVTAMLPTMTYVLMQFIGTSTAANLFFKSGMTKQGMNVTKSLIVGTAKDVDSDGHFEPLKEGVGNTLPVALSVHGTDEFGTQLKYCTWDLGSLNLADAGYSQNNSAPPITSPSPLMARLISAGSDKTFQTSCNDPVAKGDDLVVDIFESDVLYSNGGNGGWTNDGSNVRLINPLENVSIGGVIPASGNKLDVVGNTNVSGSTTSGTGFYNYEWFRNWNSGQGLYNQANGNHFYSEGSSYWTVTSGSSPAGGMIFRDTYAGTLRGYVYHDTSGFGLLHNSGGWAVRTNPSSTELFNNVTIRSGSLYFDQANPTISASSYFTAPGGAYFNSAPVYTEGTIRARGGLQNDTGSYLELYGGITGKTHLNGAIRFPDGTEQSTSATNWTTSFNTNGYMILPNGIIFEWGSTNASTTVDTSITFPVAFPNACLNIQATYNKTAGVGDATITRVSNISKTGFLMTRDAFTTVYSTVNKAWFAIGY